jgi:hypothetical protein
MVPAIPLFEIAQRQRPARLQRCLKPGTRAVKLTQPHGLIVQFQLMHGRSPTDYRTEAAPQGGSMICINAERNLTHSVHTGEVPVELRNSHASPPEPG